MKLKPPMPAGLPPFESIPQFPESQGEIQGKIASLVQSLIEACPNCETERVHAAMANDLYKMAKKSEDEMFVRLNNATIKWNQEAVERQKLEAYSMIAQELGLGLPVGYVVTPEIVMAKLRELKG